jgi:hypothetical protein
MFKPEHRKNEELTYKQFSRTYLMAVDGNNILVLSFPLLHKI